MSPRIDRIARIETFVAAYPVVGSFKYTTAATRDTVLVKITDDSGKIGWGQSVPSRTWSYAVCSFTRAG